MAQVTGAAERLTGTARAQLATGLVIIAALVALGAVILAFPAHPAAVSGTAPVIPEKLIDGWQLSAPRGVGGAGSDVIDGWQLSAPRGVGGAGSDVIDGWQLSAPRGVGGNSLNP